MEAIILSKEQFDGLISKINEIHEKVNSKTAPKQEVFLDNEELIAMLKNSHKSEAKSTTNCLMWKRRCRIITTNLLQKSE